MTARTVRFVFAALVVAGIALVGAGLGGGSASAADPGPPAVKSGVSAQTTCQQIVDAGYAPYDYVLWGGDWSYQPEWTGADAVRMSWLWRSVPACLTGAGPHDVQPSSNDPEEPEKVVLERREPEREYQPSHREGGGGTLIPIPDGKVRVTVLTRNYITHPEGRVPPSNPVVKRETKECVPRDCLTGQEWYDTYGTEHPRGSSYDPDGYDPRMDPNHDDYDPRRISQVIGDANYQFRSGNCWNGEEYIKCQSDLND